MLQCTSVASLIETASIRCTGPYLDTFGHQKKRFCSNSTNAPKKQTGLLRTYYGSSMLQKLSRYPGKRDKSSAALTGSRATRHREAGRALALTGSDSHKWPFCTLAPPRKQRSKSQTDVQYDPGTVVPAAAISHRRHLPNRFTSFCHIQAAQPHCRATEGRGTSLRENVWVFCPLKKTFPATTSL